MTTHSNNMSNASERTSKRARAGVPRLEILPVLVAAALSAVLLWSGREQPLPVLGWAAAFLFLVVERDLYCGRIPNLLTLPAFGLALGLSAFLGGTAGVLAGLGGAAVAFAVLLPAFAVRVLGAGDVKAFMVLGALWGAETTLALIAWSLFSGGALAILVLALRGGLRETLERFAGALIAWRTTHRFTYLPPSPESAAAGSMPAGAAIALAVIANNLWGAPWS